MSTPQESQEVPWPGSPEQYWTYRCETGARFRQYLASLPVAAQASVHNEVLASIGEYYDGQQVNFTAVIVIASGVRSAATRPRGPGEQGCTSRTRAPVRGYGQGAQR